MSGRTASTQAIASCEGRSDRNVRMMLNLAFPAPDIVEKALARKLPAPFTASHIAQGLPIDWLEQRRWIFGSGAG
ncbi:MAG: hypothetical protein ACKVON_07900 [Beijerinckiaceae bacterium]